MIDWLSFVLFAVCAFVGYMFGYREGTRDSKFVPTQESWVEVQKYQWSNPYQGRYKDDEE